MIPVTLANLILIGTKLKQFPLGHLQAKPIGLQIITDLKEFQSDPTYHSSGILNDLENDAHFFMAQDLKTYLKNPNYIRRIGKEIKQDARLLKDIE